MISGTTYIFRWRSLTPLIRVASEARLRWWLVDTAIRDPRRCSARKSTMDMLALQALLALASGPGTLPGG